MRNLECGPSVADTRLQKILANPKPEQPHDPKGNKEPNANHTFFWLGLGYGSRIHAIWGLA